jgi:type I restriction-modification system DNA methylase subunit
MAIKKSALYSSLWSSCDELRGGMDARFVSLMNRYLPHWKLIRQTLNAAPLVHTNWAY